jgi:uncharacterized protein
MKPHHLKWIIAALLSALLLAGCATFDEKLGQIIFNPSDKTWGSGQLTADESEVWIDFPSQVTGKQTRIHGVLAGTDKTKPVLLYLHGARWNVLSSSWRIQSMRNLGFTVLAIDYRGFGKSDSEVPSEAKSYEDAQAAWQWLAKNYPQQPRVIFGHSLGGAIAIELAKRVNDERGTIVEGTFTSIPDVYSTLKYGWLPLRWLIFQRFDSESKVAEIGSPLLVVHGARDQLIKPELGKRLFEAGKNPKRFVLVDEGSHHNTNGLAREQYRLALTEMFGL